AWGYPDSQGKPGVPNGTLLLGGSKQFADSTKGTRDGFMAVLEWKPSAEFSSLLDVYYSKFDQKTVLRGYEAGLEWGGGTLSNPTVAGGMVTAGTWTSIKPVLRNDLNKRDDDITALGWNNKFTMGNGWTAIGDLSFSKADRNESILETYAGTINTRDTVRFTTDANGRPTFTYGLNYADPNIIKLLDSGGWGQDGYIKYPKVSDEMQSIRLTAKKDLDGIFSSVEFGLNYSQREKTRFVDEYFLTLKTPNTTVPSGLLLAPSSLGFIGVPGILSYDVQGALDSLYNLRSNINNRDIINKEWRVEEKVTTAFAKLEIDSEWGGLPVRGNVGLQAVQTDQSSSASAVSNTGPAFLRVPFNDGKKYTDILPSLNLAFSLPYQQTLRVGIAKTLARARLDQLRASNNYSVDLTRRVFTGDGGNPRLEPFRANALDVSWEKYFGNKAYVGVAGFYKDLKNFIYQDKIAKDFTGYPNNTAVTVVSNIGEFSTPINGQGGNIKGFEYSASLPLNLIAEPLDGFGVVASHSDTKSGIKPNGPNGGSQPLPGLSRRVTNITAYFEKFGFSARVSQRERSDFVGEVTGFGADREFRYIKGEKVLDFQLGYAFESGSLKGLSILFQVNNANNEPYRTYDTTPNKPNQYTTYGRTTLLGVNYKF
ncbi:MAG: TonB-dependent receptor, partial [Betaproteobacteria bacterium]|nr:TonB-dependent receptor [Betaproteobacteria bacterium]